MLKSVLIGFMSLGLATTAVAKDVKKAAAKPEANTMKIDTAKSEITWTGKKVLVDSRHMGTMKLKSGEVTFNKGDLTAGKFEIDMNSIKNTDIQGPKAADLEGHLKNADFFDAGKYPTATFTITSVKALKGTAGQPTHEITGDLKMKEKTEKLTFPATVTHKGDTAEATAKVTIDRTKWDVRYGSDKFFKGLGDKVIANEIDLDLKLSATK